MDRKYGLKVLTPPVSQPVTVADAMAHMRIVGYDADDMYIDYCIRAATEFIEQSTSHTLTPTQYLYTCDQFPFDITTRSVPYDYRRNAILLPRNPVITVDEFAYTDNDGDTQLITDYVMSNVQIPCRIVPARGSVFPFADYYGLDSVRIKFTAGYVNDDYPYLARQAVLFMVSHLYENREPVSEKTANQIPFALKHLINKLKLSGFVS